MSFALREYQSQAIDALLDGWDKGGQRLAVVLPTGAGKGHPLTTEVPTPQGLRRWGELRKGDEVFGSNGYPTRVTEIYDRGKQPLYRVTMSDGSSVETDGDHLWSVRDMQYRRTGREQRTLSTRELYNEPKKLKRGYRFRIPMAGIVQRERAELPIDPYTLGAMLANGSMVNGGLQLTTPDDEVVKRIRRFYKVTKINDTTPGACPRYWLPELRQPIAELGLDVYSGEKFIPRQYLEASASQRLALLQGLMDGDGSTRADTGRRSALYHSTAQGLLDGVQELVTSLGGNASVSWSKRPDGRDCGTVRLLLPSGIHPFFTQRKGAEPQGPRQLQPRRAIVSVEYLGTGYSRCITVSAPDSLYLVTRNHIVTHNTVVFSHLIRELRRTRRIARVLVLAHREELLEQAADKIRKVSPHLRVGIVKGGRNEHDNAHVVVASVQTMSYRRPCRNQQVDEDGNPMGRCNQCSRCSVLPRAEQIKGIQAIIVDEAHHAAAPSYKRVLRHYGGFDEGGIPVAGFTATMTRDKGGLAKVWEDVVYTRDIADMISDGFLVKPHAKQVVVPGMDLDQAKKTAGDFTAKSLAQLMLDADAMSEIAKAYQEYASDRPGIVFCPTVEVAHAMTDAFNDIGIPSATVWGDMADEERREVLRKLNLGLIQVVVNCMVLTEGFDEPKVSCLVVARPTMNPGLYIQMAGRVLRPAPEAGKTDALILDVTGVTTRHKLASIVDLTGKAKKTKSSYMEDEEDEEEETEPTITAETEAGMEMQKELLVIGGWKDIDLFAATSDVRWVTSKKGYPFIVAGGRGYFLVPGIAPGTYHARVIIDGVASKPPKDPAVPSLARAREELERIARAKAGGWDNKDAPWRKRKPSDKQAALARKMGIDVTPDMKAGQVSDAIDARKVSRFVDAEVARHEEALAKLRGRTTT